MKISAAKQAYSAQLQTLQAQRQALRKTLQEQENSGAFNQNFDRVELSRELSLLDAQYEAVRGGMEGIMARESAIHNAEVSKQQGEAMAEAAEELSKMLEVYRRIASGGQVPPADERKLMEFSSELYMAAKNMAFLKAQKGEKYDSLWEDEEEDKGEEMSASEIAGNSEIAVASPEDVAARAAADAGASDAAVTETPPAVDIQV